MKVAHLISHYLPGLGGAQICVHNVAIRHLKKDDHVVVITPTSDKDSKDYGYPIVRISNWYIKFLRVPLIGKYLLWHKLNGLQKIYRFDIWQVTIGYPLGAFAVSFFNKENIPCILRCCGEDIQVDKRLSYGYRLSPSVDRIVRDAYPKYDALVALTESVVDEYCKLKIPDEKIYVIPNGVNLQRFERRESKEEIKRKLGFENKIVLLTVGRNHLKKGYNLIPTILEKVYRKRNDLVWVVIGKGCNHSLYSDLPEELRKRLILLDGLNSEPDEALKELPPSRLIDYYHGADLFVFPSYIETFGMVLIEANAAGLPVVTSNAPGCRDVIKDGYNGLLAEPGNCEMFAEKILTLIENKALYQRISDNLSDYVKEFDWKVVARRYRNLYKEVLDMKKNHWGTG